MGMDLIPINPAPDAPRYPADDKYSPGAIISGRYNWSGWDRIANLLYGWGIDLEEFRWDNDGYAISDATCKQVADAIEKHLPGLPPNEQRWLQPHIILWRTCGGYKQL